LWLFFKTLTGPFGNFLMGLLEILCLRVKFLFLKLYLMVDTARHCQVPRLVNSADVAERGFHGQLETPHKGTKRELNFVLYHDSLALLTHFTLTVKQLNMWPYLTSLNTLTCLPTTKRNQRRRNICKLFAETWIRHIHVWLHVRKRLIHSVWWVRHKELLLLNLISQYINEFLHLEDTLHHQA